MSRICPNCNYARKASDTTPDWQCPACEKAYNKAAGAAINENYGRYAPVEQPASKSVSIRWLFVLIIMGTLAWLAQPLWNSQAGPAMNAAAQQQGQPEVLLYATEWCGYCAATREFFAANGIRYSELDIEKSSEASEGHRKFGGNGVPLIVVGGDIVHGYNEDRLRALLKPWLKQS